MNVKVSEQLANWKVPIFTAFGLTSQTKRLKFTSLDLS